MKSYTKYICQKCGYESAQWLGKCPNCGEWNSLVETVVQKTEDRRLNGWRSGDWEIDVAFTVN
ncbi:hypothetical protein HZB97_03565 [Candidatus Gottesmanbacteria bacterium]|nr:hypothetical protein [Candidatus Gottesmanbacteria bacterium]